MEIIQKKDAKLLKLKFYYTGVNHGTLWCIDHRWSVSYLVNYGITDPSIINSLENLRPLLVVHNLSKHNKNEHEYFELYPDIANQYPTMPEFKFDSNNIN